MKQQDSKRHPDLSRVTFRTSDSAMPSPVVVVLLHPHLFHDICAFQDGIHGDLLPLPSTHFDTRSCQLFDSTLRTSHPFLTHFHDAFAPWFETHPHVQDTLRLLYCRPHLHSVVIAHAASYGQMSLLTHLAPQLPAHRLLLEMAAWHGQRRVVQFLVLGVGYTTCTSDAIDGAARNGHLDVLRFLHMHTKATCTTDAMDLAAMNGHLEVVQFLQIERQEGCTHWAIDTAAGNGHENVVRFLHSHGAPCTTDAMNRAARNGHLEVVRFLHTHRQEGCTTRAVEWAAMNGHLDVVQFLHLNRPEGCTTNAMDDAACFGHLNVVRFLHENRTEGCTTYAMNYAATNGHLEVVRFLHEHRPEGCTTLALDQAYRNGHAKVVQFLRKHRPAPDVTKWSASLEQVCAGVMACGLAALAVIY
ncbi:Aste57867_12297 [Aphanomyces stellatus]|uniref:Aste57867_12297 protein n=1 Tax=Aphanomyces stellatus TaxID=120398 RepID=A0A485KVZ9_9STRA|nr:hypothetical protein As57867_012251 [Aphanomyces stellatus]VFT89150.1 Aste57867_12297 [Aphanomyces stellatus]